MNVIAVVIGLTGSTVFILGAFWLAGVESFGAGYVLGILTGAVFGIIARDWHVVH